VNDPASPWETGPTNECASTDRQSPIPFPPVEEITEVGPYASVEGRYRRERLNGRVANNGHTVKVTIDGEVNTLKITALVDANDHRTYHLKEFHFHAPSEHHLGVAHAFELHLVHKNPQPAVCTVPHMEDGAVAVGILFTVGAANVALGHILDGTLPAAPEHGHPPTEQAFANDVEIDLVTGLLDSITSFITYPGSLTTPPCTQVVRWLVSTTPLTLSQDQLDKFKNVLPEHHNARPMQTRNVEGQPITRVDTVTFASQ
jgi:carbonic anhydrase